MGIEANRRTYRREIIGSAPKKPSDAIADDRGAHEENANVDAKEG